MDDEFEEQLGKELKLLKQGAEAKVYACLYLGKPTLVKERFEKNYRHPELDATITKERMKNEARSIVRCKTVNVKTPALYLVDFDRRRIYMEYFKRNISVKDFLVNYKKEVNTNLPSVTRLIGETIRKLHMNNIIHGDLTTSNMLLIPNNAEARLDWAESEEIELAMIDFGLSYTEASTEDKGVDLYVLERAIISTHNDYPDLFNEILKAYKEYSTNNIEEILSKFEEVRARGRKRTMVG